jgi:F0F1-type ATP synthase membrane subunit b/b'
MSTPLRNDEFDRQAQALLQQVTDDREQRCAALRATVDQQARQIVRRARAQARQSVDHAVAQERTRLELGLRQARARADIEARHDEQRCSRKLLDHMWSEIEAALERRWSTLVSRSAWIEAAMSEAGRVLGGRDWLIESALELQEQTRSRGAGTITWSLQPALPAGLRISANGVCVDATVTGLLSARGAIEAAFLAEYLAEQANDG